MRHNVHQLRHSLPLNSPRLDELRDTTLSGSLAATFGHVCVAVPTPRQRQPCYEILPPTTNTEHLKLWFHWLAMTGQRISLAACQESANIK